MGITIPDKLFFKIGEVARMASVRPSVLRFWESEFEFLKPDKSTTGQRLYTRKEVDLILLVRQLLYDEKFTIEGVKKRISHKGKVQSSEQTQSTQVQILHLELLKEIKNELMTLRVHLNQVNIGA